MECAKKKTEFEESVACANKEKEMLIDQKELVVQQLLREKNVLQVISRNATLFQRYKFIQYVCFSSVRSA